MAEGVNAGVKVAPPGKVAADQGGEEEAGGKPASSSSHKDEDQEKAVAEGANAGVKVAPPQTQRTSDVDGEAPSLVAAAGAAVDQQPEEPPLRAPTGEDNATDVVAVEPAPPPSRKQQGGQLKPAPSTEGVKATGAAAAASGAKWCGWISKCCMSRCSTHLEQTKHSCLSARHGRCRSPGRSRRGRRPSGGQPRAVLMCMNHKSSCSQPISR